jgi:nucleotide-binding universal stress UspA family protein
MARKRPAPETPEIVVGSDFSEGSKRALARAAGLARDLVCRLVVVNVVSQDAEPAVAPLPREWSSGAESSGGAANGEARLARARDEERRLLAELGHGDAEPVALAGKPYEALATTADARHARLLVLGVHAPMAPHETFFLGSTAERVLRTGRTPVLLARRDEQSPYRRILVPVDLGDMSLAVLRFVATNFPDAAYDVVHFLKPATSQSVTAKERRDTFLASLSGLALGAGLSPARTRVRVFVADPREGILGEVRSRAPDLIAMGTQARSGVARVLLGSVADYVLHATPGVDVLVVPPAGR